jgi:hypothetical protein
MPQSQGLIQKTPLLASCQPHEQPTLQHALTPNSDDEWPKEPRSVHRNKLWSLCDIFVDILLTGCCILFLVFAILVHAFDGVQVEDHEALTEALVKATTYVSRSRCLDCGLVKHLLTYFERVQLFCPFFSLLSLAEQAEHVFSGVSRWARNLVSSTCSQAVLHLRVPYLRRSRFAA